MSKLLIILAIVALVIWWSRRNRMAPTNGSRDIGRETTMVRCAQCDLYLPPANAAQRDGRWYCQRHQ
jgi:hypothetical protein